MVRFKHVLGNILCFRLFLLDGSGGGDLGLLFKGVVLVEVIVCYRFAIA